MLYRWPGKHAIHGDKFDYIIVPISEVEDYLSKGWSLTTDEAKDIKPFNEIKTVEASRKPKPKPKPKPKKEKNQKSVKVKLTPPDDEEAPKKVKYSDITEEIKEQILNSDGSILSLSKKFGVSRYAINRIKKDGMDKKTTY